ncbi:uncharacterized protein VSU04_013102 [Chlamydotis macqueenii]
MFSFQSGDDGLTCGSIHLFRGAFNLELLAFHRGRSFFGHESTRQMERSRRDLQVQGSGAVSEHSCWLGLNHGTSAFSSAVLGSGGCGAAPGSHSLKGKGVAKPQAGAQSGWMKAATYHCGSVFWKMQLKAV